SKDRIEKAVEETMKNGTPWDLELPIITGKGNEKWIRTIGEVEFIDNKPVRVYGSLQDIHTRKVAELKLQKSTRHINAIASLNAALLNYSEWFEALENHLGMIGEAVQADRVYYFENRFDAETGEGFTTQKLEWCREGIKSQLNNPDLDEVPFNEVPELVNPMVKGRPSMVSLREVAEGTTTRYVMEDQDIITFLAIPIKIKGIFYGFVGFDNCTNEEKWSDDEVRTLKTITSNLAVAIDRHQTENERKELLEEKNRILESISDAFYAITSDWTITYFNREAERLLEKDSKQVVGKNIWEVFPVARETELFHVYKEVLDNKSTKSIEYFYPPSKAWFDVSAYPADEGISVYFKNITERKISQKKIQQKTRQLDAIARFNSLLIQREHWIDALEESLQSFGIVAGADRSYFFENSTEVNGRFKYTSIRLEWVRDGVKPEIDNPTHKNQELSQIAELYKPLSENKPFNKIVTNIDDADIREIMQAQGIKSLLLVPVFIDRKFTGFIGFDDCQNERIWSEEEVTFLQTISLNLASAIENESAEQALQKAFKEKNQILESIRDGFFAIDNNFKVEYWNNKAEELLFTPREKVLNKDLWDVFDKNLAQVSYQNYSLSLKKQIELKFEDYFAPIDRWFDINVYPSANGISVFFKDITDRKQDEERLKELNRTLEVQTQKLAASNAELEQFAFVASHDLQEPLRMITSFLAQLERKYDHILDEKGKKYIHFATDGAKRMRQIILDLLDYSRVGRIDTEREEVDVEQTLDAVNRLHHKLIEDTNASVTWEKMPVIRAARVPIQQLFQNLIHNALRYHEIGNKPVVKIWVEDSQTHWKFYVKDNGIGINPEYKFKIFNIFQRLHGRDEYSGTGVGLAICKKIVEDHGGEIGVV
ncbi:MAG: PAS domain S-box protein, partial [Balneolales bacterium]|nr:PAS domain S-box protein [Balneolales bacterium]